MHNLRSLSHLQLHLQTHCISEDKLGYIEDGIVFGWYLDPVMLSRISIIMKSISTEALSENKKMYNFYFETFTLLNVNQCV